MMNHFKVRVSSMAVFAVLGFLAFRLPASAAANIPVQLGAYDTAGTANGVAISGNYAYVADGADGLLILNITNPSSPSLVGSYDTPGDAKAVALIGTNAVVADGTGGLQIISVASLSAPTFVAKYGTATTTANDVTISGTTAYASIQDTSAGSGVAIIDLSTLSAPALRSTIAVTPTGHVTVSGTTAYIPTNVGISIYNVTTPTTPVLLGSLAASDLNGMFVNGTTAYLAGFTAALSVVDLSTPSAPVLNGNFPSFQLTGKTVNGLLNEAIAGTNNRLYVVAGSGAATDNTLLTFDTTTPLAPILTNSFDLANKPNDLTAVGTTLYVPLGTSGLQILDMASVGKPIITGVTLTKNVFKEKRGTTTITFRPFDSSYSGRIYARKIDFGAVRGFVYLFIPTQPFKEGTIALYSSAGKLIQRVKVGGRFFHDAVNVSLVVETLNNHVYLAIGEKVNGATVRAYDVTPTALTRVLAAPAGKGKFKNGNVLVKFLAAYTDQWGLVSMIQGHPSTAKVWKLSTTTNTFIQDTSFSLKKLKFAGVNISLK